MLWLLPRIMQGILLDAFVPPVKKEQPAPTPAPEPKAKQ
jgi:hypothetical protein